MGLETVRVFLLVNWFLVLQLIHSFQLREHVAQLSPDFSHISEVLTGNWIFFLVLQNPLAKSDPHFFLDLTFNFGIIVTIWQISINRYIFLNRGNPGKTVSLFLEFLVDFLDYFKLLVFKLFLDILYLLNAEVLIRVQCALQQLKTWSNRWKLALFLIVFQHLLVSGL